MFKICKVVSIAAHPNADKLYVCNVSIGKETIQVVSGAPNLEVGMFSIVAIPITKLKTNDMLVTEVTVRGIRSYGQLCSESDLGISDDHSGIIKFDRYIRYIDPESIEDLNNKLGTEFYPVTKTGDIYEPKTTNKTLFCYKM